MTRPGVAGTGLLVAGAFFLMQLAWVLSLPQATGIDEFDHLHRAASVATGDWSYAHEAVPHEAGRGDLVPVPQDIVAATNPGCESFHYVGRANCNAYAEAGDGNVMVASAAARYNPLFYALVGYPGSLFEGHSALLTMRLAAATLGALMLGLGAVALRSFARTGWPLLGLFLAATPTVLYSTGIATPNGLHIVSGLTLWSALLGLRYGPDDGTTRRRLMAISAVAAVTLVNTHTLGVMWLALIVVAVLVLRGTRRFPRVPLAQRRAALLTVAIVVVGVLCAVGWVLAARTNDPTTEVGDAITESWWPKALFVGVPLWPLQAIAAFPMRDEPAPLPVYAIGVSLMCIAAVMAVRSLVRRRDWGPVWAIAFVATMSFAVPLVLTAMTFQHIGLAWQGRYEMPFAGGLLLLFAVAIERSGTRLPRPVVAVVLALIASMNLMGQLRIVHAFDGSPVAEAVGWAAPSGLLLAGLALGFTVLGAVAVTRLRAAPGARLPVAATRAGRAEDPLPSPAR